MSKEKITSMADAISKLESVSQSKAESIKDHLEKDYESLKAALESVKPYFEDIKEKAEKEATAAKKQVEASVKENPWLALGIVGLVAFVIGLFIGRDRK